MGGQKFQYDESGGTFFYFLLSFLALLLLPGTYYWWPRKRKQGKHGAWGLTGLLEFYCCSVIISILKSRLNSTPRSA